MARKGEGETYITSEPSSHLPPAGPLYQPVEGISKFLRVKNVIEYHQVVEDNSGHQRIIVQEAHWDDLVGLHLSRRGSSKDTHNDLL